MSNNHERFIQCAITNDNDNSTLKNWFQYQYKQVEYLAWIGIASILGQGAVMLKLWLLGDI